MIKLYAMVLIIRTTAARVAFREILKIKEFHNVVSNISLILK